MSLLQKEVVIFGNGLVAYALALVLNRKGIDTLLICKPGAPNNYSDWWENVQSPFIEQIKELTNIDIQPSWAIPCNHISSAWSTTLPIFNSSHQHHHMHKKGLIDHLKDQVRQYSIPIRSGKLKDKPNYVEDHWILNITGNDDAKIKSQYWIDATGRNGALINRYYTDRTYFDDHIALTKYFKADNTRHGSIFSIESIEHGWWYILTSEGWTQLTLITNRGSLKNNSFNPFFHQCLAQSYYSKGYVQSEIQSILPYVLDARMGIEYLTSSDYWCAVGESAFSTDPLCGHGNQVCLDHAIRVGAHLEAAIKENKPLFILDAFNHSIFIEHLKTTQSYYLMEKRWPASRFWNR